MADDRVPLVLKFGDWPESDKELWATITAEGGFMEDRGPGATWSVGTRRTFQQGYGQWLSHLMRVEPSAILFDPLSRITEERMRIYLGELRARLKPRSQVNLVRSLLVLATAAAPEDDWVWLDRAIKRLVNAVSSVSVPPAKPITARQFFHQSLKRIGILLAQLEDRSPDRHQAIQFRQSLMIAFLIARPVRRRALLAMDIDRRLTRSGDGFRVSLEAGDMKDRKARRFPLPDALVEPMQAYLDWYRPVLLGGNRSSALWISQYGKPLTADGLSRELPKVVERQFGVAMRPHAFRHVAATSIAGTDPEHVGIIKDILGHATLAMADKHYNRATGISSCNALQSIVEDIRSNVPKMRWAKQGRHDPRKS